MVIAMTRLRPPRWLPAVLLIIVASAVGAAYGQAPAPFRLTHTVDRSNQAQVIVTGRVFSDARADAIDVYVTAEALDSAGKVVASGVSYVGTIASGSSAAFVIKVPGGRPVATFRVLVTSFRFGFANQS
jgi:hypothetical protein